MNRVSWRDPWSIQIKQRHWLVILQWDPWLVYINETTFIHHFYGKQLFFVTVYLTRMFICLRFSTFSYFDLKRLQRSEEIKDNLGTKFPNAISLRLKRKNKTPLQPPAKLCHVPPNLLTPVYVMGPRIFPMMHRVKVVQWFHHVAREVSVLCCVEL